MRKVPLLFIFMLLIGESLLTRCQKSEGIVLNIDRIICSWNSNGYVLRGGTAAQPNPIHPDSSVVELMFLTNTSVVSTTSGGVLMANELHRLKEHVVDVRIFSESSFSGMWESGNNLADTLFTIVYYPNLTLRDFQRGIDHFNDYSRKFAQSSGTYFMYFRPRTWPVEIINVPFQLDIYVDLDDGRTIHCPCDYVVVE